ncbi:MAG TPA: PEGA domain-containing protein [Polyangiaceae bacterium]|nr:MAG: PEGA domain protein [Deltaproteobacteria bacterium ADurb.Bin207]HNS96653.1 PEGA domain-containing protein [Polyangiaceae bacterium]HNZ23045.1 PEGA domain-containing protein [Polyangiaceae bacterium]HOD21178.1 PEGA domain-containing protein [Polyangiaceae bacterium]HOE49058.1 PEGA domain-containing protein [Polyangiaceae bacterium]
MMVSVLAMLASSVPSVVHAQAKPTKSQARPSIRAELPEEARRSWDLAIELFEARDYQGARVEFMRAFDLSRNPRVLFNVGVCDKNLRRYARAAAVWRQQLDTGSAQLSEEDISTTRAAIAAVEPFVGMLTVRANIEGATLLIDGEEAGQTPFLGPISVDVGRHEVRLRKPDYRDHIEEVEIASGQPGLIDIKLDPVVKTALVEVTVPSPVGAVIFVDGIDMGPAPFKGELTVGRHTIEARAAGFVTARQTSDVHWNQPVRLTLSLSRERHDGKVRIRVSEADATIMIDGKAVGRGSWEGILPTGGHQLMVKKDGFETYTSDIALSDDQVRTMTVPLVREARGAAWVWWTVGSVAVLAGGALATYAIAKPTEQAPIIGTWAPGNVPTGFR